MAGYASGRNALAISDRSGLRFPYTEMVREWNGSLVHYSEYEAKQPQLQPAPVGSDPQALQNPRVQGEDTPQLILLNPNPFEIIISGGNTFVNVYSLDHQRLANSVVRLRGAPQVIVAGAGGAAGRDAPRGGMMGGLSYNLPGFVGVQYQPKDYTAELDRIINESLFKGMI